MNAHALAVAVQLVFSAGTPEKFPTELGGLTSDGASRGFDDPAYGVTGIGKHLDALVLP